MYQLKNLFSSRQAEKMDHERLGYFKVLYWFHMEGLIKAQNTSVRIISALSDSHIGHLLNTVTR
jgi:hypothetical protein